MQTSTQRQHTYDAIYLAARNTYAQEGVAGVAQYFSTAMTDLSSEDDILFMRLSACIRAEGLQAPTTSYIDTLLKTVRESNVQFPPQRIAVLSDMLTQISADVLHDLVRQAMNQSRAIAVSLGSKVDFVAASKGPEDGEWMTLEEAPQEGSFLH